MAGDQRVVALVGGVGGAKLAHGLAQVLPPERLTVIVNTGDDFTHYGLPISPDLDTVMYTLAGLVDKANGWGVANDTRQMIDALRLYGEPGWFGLGDRDLATHLLRLHLLNEGCSLTEVTQTLTSRLGISQPILPMSDDPAPTILETVEYGALAFQTYFVRYRWQPTVTGVHYAPGARVAPAAAAALAAADVVIIAPSNPWLSVAPMLALDGMADLLRGRAIPRVAISPIVQGSAIKGPAAKLMAELGYPPSAAAVAAYYDDWINGFVYDVRDSALAISAPRTTTLDTIMTSDADRARLAQAVLAWITGWSGDGL